MLPLSSLMLLICYPLSSLMLLIWFAVNWKISYLLLIFKEFLVILNSLINFQILCLSFNTPISLHWLILLQLISSEISKWSNWLLLQLCFSLPLTLLQNYISIYFWFATLISSFAPTVSSTSPSLVIILIFKGAW